MAGIGDFPVSGKIVVVTGGGSGIGLSFTKYCLSKGAKVLVGDLRLTSEAQSLVDNTPKDSLHFQKCDVTSWPDLKALITTSVQVFGSVPDVYAPVAGIFEPTWSNFWEDTEEDSGKYKTMQINVDHPVKLTRLAFTALLGADKKGVVILVSSGAGLYGNYLATLYCTSKHAIVGLAKSLAPAEENEGVKVCCICPGVVTTPLWTDRQDDKMKLFHVDKESTPALTPDEVAEAMLRLVEDGKYLGGAVMAKYPGLENLVEKGGPQSQPKDEQGRELGASSRVKQILAKERGTPWKA